MQAQPGSEDDVDSMVWPSHAWVDALVSAPSRDASREASFERLFASFSQPIYTYVLRMAGDPDRAADIAQDTFIKAYRKLDTLADESSARSWLYRIATNTAIDEMRRRRFFRPMGDDEREHDRPDPQPGPEAQFLAASLDDRIQRALLRLRPNHRQCLILSDVEDMNAHQIGELMGMSYGAVRTLLCRARGEMRRELAEEGIGA
ncbi:MAG: RNA polymerase sigma factor [Chloroflexota bacterium]|nr:RNA polymerase sigma factor [Chloroflexota bacterium]